MDDQSTSVRSLRWLPSVIVAIMTLGAALTGCSDDEHSYVPNVGDGSATPTMSTLDVNTFISDSGYTRYFIAAPVWNMYDEADEPFWMFPDGLELEQYDRKLRVAATMRCDSAKYLSDKRIWRLDGNVVMVNTQRDSFLTQQVFWDQLKREVYSDSFIHIVREDRVMEGYGFTSDEQMTAYTVNRPTGIFPIDREKTAQVEEPDSTDGGISDVRRRLSAPTRSSQRRDTVNYEALGVHDQPGTTTQPPAPANPSANRHNYGRPSHNPAMERKQLTPVK